MEHIYPKLVHIWLRMLTGLDIGCEKKRKKQKLQMFHHHFSGRKLAEEFFLVGMTRNVLVLLRKLFNSSIQLPVTLVEVFLLASVGPGFLLHC